MTERAKKIKTGVIITAVMIIGILMILMSDNKDTDADTISPPIFDEAVYGQKLEDKLKSIVEQIDGVGTVSVMITLEGSAVYNYATDTANDTRSDGDSKRESTVVLSAKGSNTKEAVVSGYSLPDVKGAAIVCSRTLTPSLQGKVIGVAAAALGIPTSRIFVTN